ncbi:MAG TPA: DUF3592 domain-containing protein [Edaphobacter sp.]|jgi:Protein of unknown function (DUF3592)|nr:DUF3592 domain-containing protein [Edaphobacter sp.]
MFPFDSIRLRLRDRKRHERLRLAQQWPIASAEINHWSVITADEEIASSATPYQIEASFHFTVNGEYFGGYLRSVGLTHHSAETMAKDNPAINVRYDPANPDSVAILAEDNVGNLPFQVISG